MKPTEASALVAKECRRVRFSYRTEQSYSGAAARFVRWCSGQAGSNEERVSRYLSARAEDWSAASENLALNALVFFFKAIGKPLGKIPDWKPAQRPRRLPEWLTATERDALLVQLRDESYLLAGLMAGSGLRIGEAVSLRVGNVDFENGSLTLKGAKGDKDRTTCLPARLTDDLRAQAQRAAALWRQDRESGRGGVHVVPEIARKQPNAGCELRHFWMFPAAGFSRDPRSHIIRRHHLHEDTVAKALRVAARRAGIVRRVTCHSLRHTFATEYLRNGGTIHELKELLGHTSIQTTEIYLHCLPMLGSRVVSPLDRTADNVLPFTQASPTGSKYGLG